ncbi:MAG: hypothetical protein OK422_04070 [Thaumarchaeota archaeon]|nr:hypothetical protein [Nitrososphaerota archaeon]
MNGRRWGLMGVGILLLLAGTVFALQGAGIIGGSAIMSGNSLYIYVGAIVAIAGIALLALGSRSKESPRTQP